VTTPELAALAAELDARGLRPVGRFATHAHWDHVLTTTAWAAVPAWGWPTHDDATGGPAAAGWRRALEAERDADPQLAAAAPDDRPEVLERPLLPVPGSVEPDGALRVAWPGPRTVVLPTPGHAAGHASLWLPDVRVLLAGDLLSDTEIPLLDVASRESVRAYAATLDRLAALDAAVVVPGHGALARDGEVAARFTADRGYLDALAAGRGVADLRLTTGWIAAEHARQRASLEA